MLWSQSLDSLMGFLKNLVNSVSQSIHIKFTNGRLRFSLFAFLFYFLIFYF